MARPLPGPIIKAFLLTEPRCGLRVGDRVCTMPYEHAGREHYDLWAFTSFTRRGHGCPLNPHLEAPPTPTDHEFMQAMTGPEPTHPAYRGARLSPRDPRRGTPRDPARSSPPVSLQHSSIDQLLDDLEEP